MEVGPRIVILVICAAVGVGLRDSARTGFNLEAAFQTILFATAVNWCLKLVSQTLEDRIMEMVRSCEDFLLSKMTMLLGLMAGCFMACYRGIKAWWRRETFPPIIDV